MKMTKDMDLVRQHWLIKTHMKDCMRKENVMDKELTGTYLFNLKTKCSHWFISFFFFRYLNSEIPQTNILVIF